MDPQLLYAKQSATGRSPIHTLPSEILGEIFVELDSFYQPPALSLHAKWIITRVCAGWRAAARSTPRLWTAIELDHDSPGYISQRSLRLLISQQIQWSGALPLMLRYRSPYVIYFSDANVAVLEVLLSAADRWKWADLCMSAAELQSLNNFTQNGSFRTLERLKLIAHEGDDPELHRCGIYAAAPQLKHLDFPRLYNDVAVAAFQIPWAQLTSCVLTLMPHDVLRILPRLPNLVEATFSDLEEDFITTSNPHLRITCKCLRSLTLITDGHPVSVLLDSISAPALEHLSIGNAALDDDIYTAPMLMSARALIYLVLSRAGFQQRLPAATMLGVLERTPHLEHVSFWNADVSAEFVDAMTCAPNARRILVQRLQFLLLAGNFSCESELIVEMLRSRNAASGVGTLRAARFYPDLAHQDYMQKIIDMQVEGLDVSSTP